MANEITPESIQKIKIGNEEHPIDAVSVGGKTIEQIGTLVNTFDGNVSDHSTYPSAKLVWDTIGDLEQRLSNI